MNNLKFDTKAFNKAVGEILYSARTQSQISYEEVSKAIPYFSNHLLSDVEKGLRSLPCNVLSQLFGLYQMNEEQMRIFCYPEETRLKYSKSS